MSITTSSCYLRFRLLLIALPCLIFPLVFGVQASADSPPPTDAAPTFGHPILSLEIPDLNTIPVPIDGMFDGNTFEARLSSRGTYVVGRQDYFDPSGLYMQSYLGTKLRLWVLHPSSEAGAGVISLFPSVSRDIGFGNGYGSTEIAISPDEQFVAVALNGAIALYSLPELTLSFTIPVAPVTQTTSPERRTQLAWSPDSRFIAAIRENQFVVWDTQMHQSYTHNFTYEQDPYLSGPHIVATRQGWLLDRFGTSAPTFLACDWELARCQNYQFADSVYAFTDSDGSIVITPSDLNKDPIETSVWHLQSNMTYEPEESPLDIPGKLIPYRISPSGEYASFRTDNSSEVRRTSDWSLVQTLQSLDRTAWFPDENNFLVGSFYRGVRLYHTGNNVPYASQDFTSLLSKGQLERGDQTAESWTIDTSGKFILDAAGWLNLVIPIEYATPTH